MTWMWLAWARDDAAYVAERLLGELWRRHQGPGEPYPGTVRVCPRCASTGHGRPLVRGHEGASLAVSVARTSGATVVALTDCALVGVDVEVTGRFAAGGVADVVLHPTELATTPGEVATAWVRKEALLKACGRGLSVDPSSVRIDDSSGSPVVAEWPASVPRPGWVRDVALAADLSAAVAGSGDGPPDDVTVQEAGPGGSLG